jgi:hypothetical protein
MAQCYLQLKRPAEALQAFRLAYKLHPGLRGIEDNICTLEQLLNEDRSQEDR